MSMSNWVEDEEPEVNEVNDQWMDDKYEIHRDRKEDALNVKEHLDLTMPEMDLIMYALRNSASSYVPGGMGVDAAIKRVWSRIRSAGSGAVAESYAALHGKLHRYMEQLERDVQ